MEWKLRKSFWHQLRRQKTFWDVCSNCAWVSKQNRSSNYAGTTVAAERAECWWCKPEVLRMKAAFYWQVQLHWVMAAELWPWPWVPSWVPSVLINTLLVAPCRRKEGLMPSRCDVCLSSCLSMTALPPPEMWFLGSPGNFQQLHFLEKIIILFSLRFSLPSVFTFITVFCILDALCDLECSIYFAQIFFFHLHFFTELWVKHGVTSSILVYLCRVWIDRRESAQNVVARRAVLSASRLCLGVCLKPDRFLPSRVPVLADKKQTQGDVLKRKLSLIAFLVRLLMSSVNLDLHVHLQCISSVCSHKTTKYVLYILFEIGFT